ncbi:PiggyBac transposable element-derived protein 1 [Elysia marginata]|uniref:PiggyBac transposable element-derived protein 1 n=1 Tax=Elysia marginata TaxID=1093978 RepID=A0AAV4JIC9_9GAST|nr:PiggyBac transposable element-derived protein 1 [Elysia marginata]
MDVMGQNNLFVGSSSVTGSSCGASTQYTRWTLVQTEPYQGAGTVQAQPDLGMGGSVVMDLISVLPEENKYCLYFDNLFTSPALKDKGCDATGTLRTNRLNQCSLQRVDSMKKMKRGSMDHRLNPDSYVGMTIVL